MRTDDGWLMTDRSALRDVQYRTDANLSARQSLYACQHPHLDLQELVLGLAELRGQESVADVGCGNGAYLAALERHGHAGPVAGVDFSPGMLTAARSRTAHARLAVGDAAALPLRDAAADVTLACHMLYHVPDRAAAVRELRRVTRPGGRVLVVLNGDDHLRELRALVTGALGDIGAGDSVVVDERVDLAAGQRLLAPEFASVTRHDFVGELRISDPGPVADYVRSTFVAQRLDAPDDLAAAVTRRLPRGADGVFRVRTHSGCLVCR